MNRDVLALREALTDYLPEGGSITEVRPLATGHSNETYIIEGLDRILRLPPTTEPLLTGHGVVVQARIYEELGRREGAPPVPKIHYICEESQPLGDPFFIMECVAGDSVNDYSLPDWFTDSSDETRASMSEQWVEAVASIAKLAPLQALGKLISPQEQVRLWRDFAANVDCPELVSLFDQLLAIAAPSSGPAAPIHGDCKLANLMFSEGRLTAVLDWELAYNGEPLTDLGYLLYFFANDVHPPARASRLSGMWTREQVIPAWEKGSGRSAKGVEWYEVLAIGKMAAILAQGYHLYASGQSDDARFLRFKDKLVENIEMMKVTLRKVSPI